jgi:biofilm PGA synthesis protein PgaD
MDEPGQRNPYPIVDKPEVKSKLRVFSEWTFTTVLWSIYVYLFMPIVTFILWAFGIKILYYELIEQAGFYEFLKVLKGAGQAALIIILVFFLWSYYNYMMFRIRGERRNKQVLLAQDDELAKAYNVDPDFLREAKDHYRFIVKVRKDGMNIVLG